MKHIKFTMWLKVFIYSAGLCLYNCEEIEWPSNLVNIVFFVNFNSDWIEFYVNSENVENVYTCNFSVGQSTSFLHFFLFWEMERFSPSSKNKKNPPQENFIYSNIKKMAILSQNKVVFIF